MSEHTYRVSPPTWKKGEGKKKNKQERGREQCTGTHRLDQWNSTREDHGTVRLTLGPGKPQCMLVFVQALLVIP